MPLLGAVPQLAGRPLHPKACTLPRPQGVTFQTGPCAQHGSRVGDSDSSPTDTLRPAGARLPATCPVGAAASVGTGGPLFAGVTYATGNVLSASDTDTAAEAPSYPCRDAGVPPTASSPTPASCSPYGDAIRGWYPATSSSCGDAQGLVGLPTLFCPRGLAVASLAPRDGRGVRGAPCQPDMGSGASSAGLQHCHRQVDLDSQAPG